MGSGSTTPRRRRPTRWLLTSWLACCLVTAPTLLASATVVGGGGVEHHHRLQRAAIPPPVVVVDATLPPGSARAGNFVCRITGVCVPCPANEMGSPVCKIYGNRRSLTCVSVAGGSAAGRSSSSSDSDSMSSGSAAFEFGSAADAALGFGQRPPPLAPVPPAPPAPAHGDARLDPDPQNLDDEALQDQLRGGGPGGAGAAMGGHDVPPRAGGRAIGAGGVRPGRRWRAGVNNNDHDVALELEVRQFGSSAAGLSAGLVGQEIYTWEACARVVKKERADYFEFVLCNLFFASAAVALLVYRHRALASRQYGTLAARIGMSIT